MTSATTQSSSDSDHHFRTGHLAADLKGRSVRGGTLVAVSQGLQFCFRLAGTMVLARLLVPEAFGLVAMAGTVANFMKKFGDAGLAMATVQRAEINHQQVSTLFWVNLVVTTGIAALLAVAAPGLAWFYGEPRVTGVAMALAIPMLLGGLTVQHRALLRRQMRFRVLAIVPPLARAAGVIAAIVAALMGAGYWSIVVMMVVQSATNMIVCWGASGWIPGPPRRRAGTRDLLKFGGNRTGSRLLNHVSFNLDNILIGWAHGATPLALYEKAYSLLLLPLSQLNGPLNSVVIPALSALQNDAERFRNYYRRAIEFLAFLGKPMVVLMFLVADEVVLTVLGDQWVGSIGVFRALGPAALIMVTNAALGWACTPYGRPGREFRWYLFAAPVEWLSMAIGLQWGIYGLALAISIAKSVLWIPGLWYCYKVTPIRLSDFGVAVWRPLAASVFAALLSYGFEVLFLQSVELQPVRLLIIAGVFGLCYLAAWMVLPRGRERFIEMVRSMKHLRKQRSKGGENRGAAGVEATGGPRQGD